MKILYEAPTTDADQRKVFVDGVYFTRLVLTEHRTIYVITEHPRVNLAGLFKLLERDGIGFNSGLNLKVTIKVSSGD